MTFSIIIPLYNKANVVSDTLQSVLNQTFTDFEILIVNDGSTDNSMEVVQKFKDNRIKIFSKENGGVSSARNYGIKHAHGEYIALLDADDLWEPKFLTEINKLITKYPNCGIYSSGLVRKNLNNSIVYTYRKEGIIENYFKGCFETKKFFCNASCAVIPKTVFEDVGYFIEDVFAGEDICMWISIGKKYKICVTPKLLTTYQYCYSGNMIYGNKKYPVDNRLYMRFYDANNHYLNEVIAYWGIKKSITQRLIGNKAYSLISEKEYSYTQYNKKILFYLRLLNRIPDSFLPMIIKVWELGSNAKSILRMKKKVIIKY